MNAVHLPTAVTGDGRRIGPVCLSLRGVSDMCVQRDNAEPVVMRSPSPHGRASGFRWRPRAGQLRSRVTFYGGWCGQRSPVGGGGRACGRNGEPSDTERATAGRERAVVARLLKLTPKQAAPPGRCSRLLRNPARSGRSAVTTGSEGRLLRTVVRGPLRHLRPSVGERTDRQGRLATSGAWRVAQRRTPRRPGLPAAHQGGSSCPPVRREAYRVVPTAEW